MPLSDVNRCLNGVIGFVIIMMLCAMYAYYIDSKRPADDPKKKHHHPMAILLAPVTFPILLVLSILLFILKVLVYGAFAVLFIFALLLIRKPFFLEWLKRNAVKIGDLLLEANTFLIRLFVRPLRT
jgi:hypothetical protein